MYKIERMVSPCDVYDAWAFILSKMSISELQDRVILESLIPDSSYPEVVKQDKKMYEMLLNEIATRILLGN